MSYGLEILGKFIFFEDLQMLVKSYLARSNRKNFGKNRVKLGVLEIYLQSYPKLFLISIPKVKKSGRFRQF